MLTIHIDFALFLNEWEYCFEVGKREWECGSIEEKKMEAEEEREWSGLHRSGGSQLCAWWPANITWNHSGKQLLQWWMCGWFEWNSAGFFHLRSLFKTVIGFGPNDDLKSSQTIVHLENKPKILIFFFKDKEN